MVYSEEVLTQIEQYASIYLKISDMAVILGVPPEDLRRDLRESITAAQLVDKLTILHVRVGDRPCDHVS